MLLATVVEGDLKVPFSITTTPRCREGATPFPGLLHFTLYTYLIMPGGIKYHFFKVFGMTRPGIEPWSPRPLANTLPTRPESRFIGFTIVKLCLHIIVE